MGILFLFAALIMLCSGSGQFRPQFLFNSFLLNFFLILQKRLLPKDKSMVFRL